MRYSLSLIKKKESEIFSFSISKSFAHGWISWKLNISVYAYTSNSGSTLIILSHKLEKLKVKQRNIPENTITKICRDDEYEEDAYRNDDFKEDAYGDDFGEDTFPRRIAVIWTVRV